MTIYSTHPSRGKMQILATYRTPEDATASSTVTSLDDPALAKSIAEALNQVSACATLPLCVYDRRDDGFGHYPRGYLAALTDPAARMESVGDLHRVGCAGACAVGVGT